MRQKSEDLQEEAIKNMKKSIYEFQEKITSLQRVKSSVEKKDFSEALRLKTIKSSWRSPKEIKKKGSMEQ